MMDERLISLKPALSKTQLAWASTGLNAI